jgi:hypothetical protein
MLETMDLRSIQTQIEAVPSWAYQWCNIFVVIAVMSIITGLLGVLYSPKHSLGIIIVYIVSTLIQAATSMTLFWMCRASLRQ